MLARRKKGEALYVKVKTEDLCDGFSVSLGEVCLNLASEDNADLQLNHRPEGYRFVLCLEICWNRFERTMLTFAL